MARGRGRSRCRSGGAESETNVAPAGPAPERGTTPSMAMGTPGRADEESSVRKLVVEGQSAPGRPPVTWMVGRGMLRCTPMVHEVAGQQLALDGLGVEVKLLGPFDHRVGQVLEIRVFTSTGGSAGTVLPARACPIGRTSKGPPGPAWSRG